LTSNAIHGDSFLDFGKSQIDVFVTCLDAVIQCISNTKKEKAKLQEVHKLNSTLHKMKHEKF
jgi:hypothetical protein